MTNPFHLHDLFGLSPNTPHGLNPTRFVQDYANAYRVIVTPVLPLRARKHHTTARERHELRQLRDVVLEVLTQQVQMGRKIWIDHATWTALSHMDSLRVVLLEMR